MCAVVLGAELYVAPSSGLGLFIYLRAGGWYLHRRGNAPRGPLGASNACTAMPMAKASQMAFKAAGCN